MTYSTAFKHIDNGELFDVLERNNLNSERFLLGEIEDDDVVAPLLAAIAEGGHWPYDGVIQFPDGTELDDDSGVLIELTSIDRQTGGFVKRGPHVYRGVAIIPPTARY